MANCPYCENECLVRDLVGAARALIENYAEEPDDDDDDLVDPYFLNGHLGWDDLVDAINRIESKKGKTND